MDEAGTAGGLVGQARASLHARARDALWREDARAAAFLARVFASPLPLPHLDAEALGAAQGLAEAMTIDAPRTFRLLALAGLSGAAPLVVVGDSHSTHLVRRSLRQGRWMLPLHLLCTGASARGLGNPAAAAGAGARVRAILEALAGTARPLPLVFKFGQVDVEFVHAFKRLEAGERAFDADGFDAFADETVARYVGFLDEATPERFRGRASVAGLFPPALSDAAWRQGYVNAHIANLHGPADDAALAERLADLEIPALEMRTRLHARFDERLRTAAEAASFGFIDQLQLLLGPDGVVRKALLGGGAGANHHLGYAASRHAVLDGLWDAALP